MESPPGPGQWQCTACRGNVFIGEEEPSRIGDDFYCIECIQQIIRFRINEPGSLWPPRIPAEDPNGALVPIEELQDLLDGDLMRQYREHDRYRHIHPRTERVFCPRCGHFVCRRTAFHEFYLHPWERCQGCGTNICSACVREEDEEDLEARFWGMCTRTAAMDEEDRERNNPDLDEMYPPCPGCGERIDRIDGCNEMRCPCGRRFCFICRQGVAEDERNHWGAPPGCPRFGRLQDGNATWDDPRFDPENFDAVNFERLTGRGWRWREDASRMENLDLSLRVRREMNVAYDEEQLEWFRMLVLSARHVLAMMHNGLDAEERPINSDNRNDFIIRRARFAFHAENVLFFRLRLEHSLGEAPDIPGTNDILARLSRYCRRLMYQDQAVPADRDDRMSEMNTLRDVASDQLEFEYSTRRLTAIQNNLPSLPEAERARSLLEPVMRMAEIMHQHNRTSGWERFSIPESVLLRTEMDHLQEQILALERTQGGIQRFRDLGQEQSTIYDIAYTFLHHMLRDDDEIDRVLREDENLATWRYPLHWVTEIVENILTAAHSMGFDDAANLEEHVDSLRVPSDATLNALVQARQNGRAMQDILDNDLRILRDLVPNLRRGDGQLRRVAVGPLRPLYSRLVDYIEALLDANVERVLPEEGDGSSAPSPDHPPADGNDLPNRDIGSHTPPGSSPRSPRRSFGSSRTSNADNDLQADLHLVNELYIIALEAVNAHLRHYRDQPIPAGHDLMLRVTRDTRHLVRRLVEPGQHPAEQNEAIFDQLSDLQASFRNHTGESWGFGWQLRRNEDRADHLLDRILILAERSDEINPNGERRREAREIVLNRLERVGELLQREAVTNGRPISDHTYVANFLARFHEDEDRWRRPDGSLPMVYDVFLRWLQTVMFVTRFELLLAEIRDEPVATARLNEAREEVSRLDSRHSAVGDLQRTFPRLFDILINCITARYQEYVSDEE